MFPFVRRDTMFRHWECRRCYIVVQYQEHARSLALVSCLGCQVIVQWSRIQYTLAAGSRTIQYLSLRERAVHKLQVSAITKMVNREKRLHKAFWTPMYSLPNDCHHRHHDSIAGVRDSCNLLVGVPFRALLRTY